VKTSKTAEIADKIRERGGKVIASFHNFTQTPDIKELKKILHSNEKIGDISKIVTTAKSFHDNLTLLNLQSSLPKNKAVCFAMGREGVPSRVLCPLHGAPFTYASTAEGLESAPGQLTVEKLTQIYALMEVNR
jgi:3-dehydroquinate dehydratase type I